jgi:hypothetical protein
MRLRQPGPLATGLGLCGSGKAREVPGGIRGDRTAHAEHKSEMLGQQRGIHHQTTQHWSRKDLERWHQQHQAKRRHCHK